LKSTQYLTWAHYTKHLYGCLLSRVVDTRKGISVQVEELQAPAGLQWRLSSPPSLQHTLLLSGQPLPAAAGAPQPCPAVILPDRPAAACYQPHQSTGPAMETILRQTQHSDITLHQFAAAVAGITAEGARFEALPTTHSLIELTAAGRLRHSAEHVGGQAFANVSIRCRA